VTQIRLEGVSRSYRGLLALDAVSLEVASQSLTVVCGPQGSGKSVLLRLLIGLEQPTAGRIFLDDRDITNTPADERRIGYVPQSFALFPHMSVFDNIAYPMALQKVPRDEIARRMAQVAEVLRIGHLLQKRPSQLSGGEKQRAAIARGMLKNSNLFLLDDPLVGLDFKLRESLMEDLKTMRAELGATFLYATSDSLEALNMAEDLVVLDRGRVIAADQVEVVYHNPGHLRAAELVGFPRCNVLPATLAANSDLCRTPLLNFSASVDHSGAQEVMVVIRPEHIIHVADGNTPADGGEVRTGIVRLTENLGAECVVYFQVGDETLVTTVPGPSAAGLDLGAAFRFAVRSEKLLVFDRRSGARLRQAREAVHA
jgi:ABC-type sugar transport system ATPase subunit